MALGKTFWLSRHLLAQYGWSTIGMGDQTVEMVVTDVSEGRWKAIDAPTWNLRLHQDLAKDA